MRNLRLWRIVAVRMRHNVLGILPARLHSTRLPKKMLAEINGKPLIYWSWRQATKAKRLDAVIVATDAKIIYDLVEGFGGRAMMTPASLATGSDRVAYAAKRFTDFTPDIVVNIQGDEPMIPPAAIDGAIDALIKDPHAAIGTPATTLFKKEDWEEPGFVKVVLDKRGYALYFSRARIPYPRERYTTYLKHLGLYAFRADFLQTYTKLAPTPLEQAEKLEQLRALENGHKIKVVVGAFKNQEVNTAAELARARRMMRPTR